MLPAREAAAALAEGFSRVGIACEAVPLADGGEGTAEALHAALGGKWRTADVSDALGRAVEARLLLLPDGRAVVESAEAIGLSRLGRGELEPLRASSRGLGELIRAAVAAGASGLLVGLGDSATVDGGRGLREVIGTLDVPTTVLCDVAVPLLGERGAARLFGPQKGATPEQVEELERRLAAIPELVRVADLPGAGAAGGLGAALAAMGAELVAGANNVIRAVGLVERMRRATLVVTGEGTVDRTSPEGKVTGSVLRLCLEAGVRCVVFGGLVEEPLAGAEMFQLSGVPEQAREDLVALGSRLASS